jgi:hypothetical protein
MVVTTEAESDCYNPMFEKLDNFPLQKPGLSIANIENSLLFVHTDESPT